MKRLMANLKPATLIALMAVMGASCKSNQQKLAETDNAIARTQATLDSLADAYAHKAENALMFNDAYNQLAIEDKSAAEITARVKANSLIKSGLLNREWRRMARNYPLSGLLDDAGYNELASYVLDSYNQMTSGRDAARKIVLKQATLLDLVDYIVATGVPLRLDHLYSDRTGVVHFRNARADKVAAEFYAQKDAMESMVTDPQVSRHLLPEKYWANERKIDSLINTPDTVRQYRMDSIASAIQADFDRQYMAASDSARREMARLTARRDSLARIMARSSR